MLNLTAALLCIALLGAATFAAVLHLRGEERGNGQDQSPHAPA